MVGIALDCCSEKGGNLPTLKVADRGLLKVADREDAGLLLAGIRLTRQFQWTRKESTLAACGVWPEVHCVGVAVARMERGRRVR